MPGYLNQGVEGVGPEDEDTTDETGLQSYTVESVKQGDLTPLEIADMLRRSRVTSSQAAADLKTQIERARNVILNQPTKQSKADWLLGIGSTLLAPGPVGRAGTLGESLSSLGKYVSGVTEEEKKAKALQAQQLANFDLGIAKSQAAAAKQDVRELASLAEKYAPKAEKVPPSVSELLYWKKISESPNNYSPELVAAAKVKLKEAQTEKKPETDRSASAQFLNALSMSESTDPKVRARGQKLLTYLNRSGGLKLTLSMQAKDKAIDEARAAIKDVPIEKINNASKKGQYANAEEKRLVEQWKLAQRPKFAEVLSEAESDVIDVDMTGAPGQTP